MVNSANSAEVQLVLTLGHIKKFKINIDAFNKNARMFPRFKKNPRKILLLGKLEVPSCQTTT